MLPHPWYTVAAAYLVNEHLQCRKPQRVTQLLLLLLLLLLPPRPSPLLPPQRKGSEHGKDASQRLDGLREGRLLCRVNDEHDRACRPQHVRLRHVGGGRGECGGRLCCNEGVTGKQALSDATADRGVVDGVCVCVWCGFVSCGRASWMLCFPAASRFILCRVTEHNRRHVSFKRWQHECLGALASRRSITCTSHTKRRDGRWGNS